MINITQFEHPHLKIARWQVHKKQSWCVLGRNGSGKQWVSELLEGELKGGTALELALPTKNKVGFVSFEMQQRVFENEIKMDQSDLTDEVDIGTQVKDFFPQDKLDHKIIDQLNMRSKLASGYRQLSTGESRKVLIIQAVLNGVEVLLCENPFDSLDVQSCETLSASLQHIAQDITVILSLNNVQDIPAWCEQVAVVEGEELSTLGLWSDGAVKEAVRALFDHSAFEQDTWPEPPFSLAHYEQDHLVAIKQCTVTYGERDVFKNFDFTLKPLQHTLVTGSNGSGKSTLMQLITGDCPQCYSNDVSVLGMRRGGGESIWDVKKNLGIVSSELHRNYRVRCDVLSVVCSGFFDSIGVYQTPDKFQINHARHWLKMVGLESKAKNQFQKCSYGEQRLVLIARALVKSPLLLILDEPTQGLDSLNRYRVLQFIERIVEFKHTTVVLVSHRQDEHLSLFEQHVDLDALNNT